jgi:hypothetical protein
MQITVYVGDVNSSLSTTATAYDPQAQLITDSNYKALTPGTYYTSLGEFDNLNKFAEVLRQADIIVYSPPAQWSDSKDSVSYMQKWTELYLTNFYTIKQIKGFTFNHDALIDLEAFVGLEDRRQTDRPQLWISGCSFSHGTGVDPCQRYGQLIGDELDIPVSFLTKVGSSIQWAADQILRSDVRSGDIVVWGLTENNRFAYFNDNKVLEISTGKIRKNPDLLKIIDPNWLDSDDVLYHNTLSIFQVINFCNKLKIKLVIANLLSNTLVPYLIDQECFISLTGQYGVYKHDCFIDVGTDDMHPGPLMHKYYSKEILKKIVQ